MSARYLAARWGTAVYVRVEGLANMKTSSVLDDFLRREMEAGATAGYLDLSTCSGMDSTFMGLIVLQADLFRERGGDLLIVRPSAGAAKLLGMLGVSEVVKLISDAVEPGLELTPLDTRDVPMGERAQMMLAAHERLVKLSPANEPKFAAFIQALQRDVAKRSGGGAQGGSGEGSNLQKGV